MNHIADFESYLLYEQRRSGETVEAYCRDVRQFSEFLCGDATDRFDPESVTVNDIRAWLASLSTEGKTARSIRRKTQSLRAFFRFRMVTLGSKSNPAADIALAKTPSPLPDFVPTGEMETLLDNPEPTADSFQAALDHVVISTLYATGIRRAELLSLTDSSIDFGKREMRVTGKRNKTRIIPLADELLEEIRDWQELRDSTVKKRTPADRLFCGKRGTLSEFTVGGIVKRTLAPTSAVKKSPHILRHTFATSLLNGGADLNSVKELLGHASLSSTQIYIHLSFDDLRRAYDAAHPRAAQGDTRDPKPGSHLSEEEPPEAEC